MGSSLPARVKFWSSWHVAGIVAGGLLLAMETGCSHKQQVARTPPPPPAPVSPVETAPPPPAQPPVHIGKPSGSLSADEEFVSTHAPIYSETGTASWYGPPYHNRVGADGTVYNENHISAAHRTLPLGSLIRVTNLRTGQSAVMHVTDRGPFVAGRILDLSLAAARIVGVYGPGTAQVRVDVYSTPKPMNEGGRWCVQIGAFASRSAAVHLEEKLHRQYETANVIEFQGPTGFWVRVRPQNDNRQLAMQIANQVRPVEGEAWLVRLD